MTANNMKGLVSPSDIADLTGYTRGAVSNWRRRFNDFPEAVAGTAANPLFRREEALAWLAVNGKAVKKDRGEDAIWAALNVLRGSVDMNEASRLVVTLACARKLADAEGRESFVNRWRDAVERTSHDGNDSGALRSAYWDLDPDEELVEFEPRSVPMRARDIDRIIDAVASIAVPDLARATDVVLERLSRWQGKMGADHGFVGSRTSSLLATLCVASAGGTLYDPAAGNGVALLQAVDAGVTPHRIVGHDVDPDALRTARQRAFLRDVTIEVALGDVLDSDLEPELKADVIIAEPPFGLRFGAEGAMFDPRYTYGLPPKSSSDLAWVQHAVEHLAEGGRAYVILTSGTLFRGGAERSIRMGLVGAGCVEAVVGLPGKMLPHTSVALALWVLRRPSAAAVNDGVLFIDASEQTEPEADIAGWLSSPDRRQGVPHTTIGTADILARDAQLVPHAWLPAAGPDADEVVRSFAEGSKQVVRAVQELERVTGVEHFSSPPTAHRIATMDELQAQGIVKVWGGGRPAEKYADMDYPKSLVARLVAASDVRDGNLPSTPLANDTDDDRSYPHLTDPGDLLVTTSNAVRASVDTEGNHLPGVGVHKVRVKDTLVLDPDYLAVALVGRWNEHLLTGGTVQRAKLGDLEVPLVPLAEQRRIVAQLRAVQHILQLAARLSEGATDVKDAYLDALRYSIDLASSDGEGSTGPSAAPGGV